VIDEVCHQLDFVAYVQNFVDLKPSGKSWVGLCPFHAEKTPSFFVTPGKNSYFCFGCQQGGGPLSFAIAITGRSFGDCLKDLAERANYTLPVLTSGGDREPKVNRAGLFEVMKEARDFYVSVLNSREGDEAYDYLRGRGITDESIKAFGIGLAPSDWDRLGRHLNAKRFSAALTGQAGLIKKSEKSGKFFDVFRSRIMFPVQDDFPRVVAFAGRTYKKGDESAKYVNSSTTPIFEKSRVLYGLDLARPFIRTGKVAFIVEGYLDVISMFAAGVKSTVAAMGTALTQYQVDSLKGTAKEIQLVFDSDAAGLEAAKRALPLLYNADLDGRVIRLPDGHDPDTFIRAHGSGAFFDLANGAQDLCDFLMDHLVAAHSKTMTGQGKIISEITGILSQVPDAVKGQFLRNRLAERLGLSPELLSLKKVEDFKQTKVAVPALPKVDYSPLAGQLLEHLIVYPECLKMVNEALVDIWPNDRTKPVIVEFLNQVNEDRQRPKIRPESLLHMGDSLMESLIAKSLVTPKKFNQSVRLEVAKTLVGKLNAQFNKKRSQDFTSAIKRAEAMGDYETVNKLLAEK
jgi:DNA primase